MAHLATVGAGGGGAKARQRGANHEPTDGSKWNGLAWAARAEWASNLGHACRAASPVSWPNLRGLRTGKPTKGCSDLARNHVRSGWRHKALGHAAEGPLEAWRGFEIQARSPRGAPEILSGISAEQYPGVDGTVDDTGSSHSEPNSEERNPARLGLAALIPIEIRAVPVATAQAHGPSPSTSQVNAWSFHTMGPDPNLSQWILAPSSPIQVHPRWHAHTCIVRSFRSLHHWSTCASHTANDCKADARAPRASLGRHAAPIKAAMLDRPTSASVLSTA